MSYKKDMEDRKKNSWWNVELFRMVHGRLPTEEGDKVTKMTAKKFLDRFHGEGAALPDSTAPKKELARFAFHVYASSNLAYENDLPANPEE